MTDSDDILKLVDFNTKEHSESNNNDDIYELLDLIELDLKINRLFGITRVEHRSYLNKIIYKLKHFD